MPEDKLKAGMKERIVASVVGAHEKCEEAVDKRYRFEEKIKRSYFHVKPLDLKQLKNWDTYLDFEISEGDHDRIVVLFERCLIPCAQYEQFWAKYARYLEHHLKNADEAKQEESVDKENKSLNDGPLKRARWSFDTGVNRAEELKERRTTWSVKGWKETDQNGSDLKSTEVIPDSSASEQASKRFEEKFEGKEKLELDSRKNGTVQNENLVVRRR